MGSKSEEWTNIQNEKIWKDRPRWKRLCLVTHYGGKAYRKKRIFFIHMKCIYTSKTPTALPVRRG
jgi:hypothetical protein